MYLKQLDIVGFKSFADKTRLTFEPGMIAIVGPNGCGKSNVSDAIRWVLGEQRPTALRCSKLVDVVFNGTDTRKPLGLAEVSITFSDCEALLGTDYHEVTVTRRVARTGEGQYFINKTPCRLKDVQRLFMGTGIGTTSYSVMAQGQIDAILSSKPEDRRAVFEEAAGITKFKADRKEAVRKIEQTEQNLLREADVLREMKRQIGSLQRQVGKARRYKELRTELRALDVYLTLKRIHALDTLLEDNLTKSAELEKTAQAALEEVNEAEKGTQDIHSAIHAAEERLAALAASSAEAEGAYAHAQQMISVNESRIAEYRAWSERDGREIAEIRRQQQEAAMQAESLELKERLLNDALETAGNELEAAQDAFDNSNAQLDELRTQVQQNRAESIACDRKASALRNELSQLEEKSHAAIVKHDRLVAEKERLEADMTEVDARVKDVESRLKAARDDEEKAQCAAETAEEMRESFARELDDLRENFGLIQSQAAAKEAQLDMLRADEDSANSFDAGAKALLKDPESIGIPRDNIVGALADCFETAVEYRIALEAVLRCSLDAVVLKDAAAARSAAMALLKGGSGSARIVSAASVPGVSRLSAPAGKPILDFVSVKRGFEEAAGTLLGNVFIVEEDFDTASMDMSSAGAADAVFVTKTGIVFSRAGSVVEVWQPGSEASSPLTRRLAMQDAEKALEELKSKIESGRRTLETGAEKSAALQQAVRDAQVALAAARRLAAQTEGEASGARRDCEAARSRLEAVAGELETIAAGSEEDAKKRSALKEEIAANEMRRDELVDASANMEKELARTEAVVAEHSAMLTERRIRLGQLEGEMSLMSSQREAAAKRRQELEKSIEGRDAGIKGYCDAIERLTEETAELSASLETLQFRASEARGAIEAQRAEREGLQTSLSQAEAVVSQRRTALDELREQKTKVELSTAEATMRRQNSYEHLSQEYGLDPVAARHESEPEWKGAVPPDSEIAAKVDSLNAQIAELGPVNMVAIDEFQELEERYTREKAQEADLLAAKEQILQLITNLNQKSGDLFKATFEKANENFQLMFKKLFNGGEARLALLENSEDPLESGIEIIARPPGKRPQSVTLLSGGERTMTAVALLFAIFMIKPAPFCMLDELDAALDDSNIGRFVGALKDFLEHSQFLIITHNQHTIAGSDIVYGVSQQEKGISRVISMRLSDVTGKQNSGADE